MRVLGWIVLACIVLTALRWALALLAVAILLGVVIALIRAPAQTMAVLFGWLLLNAFAANPALGLILFALVILGGKLSATR